MSATRITVTLDWYGDVLDGDDRLAFTDGVLEAVQEIARTREVPRPTMTHQTHQTQTEELLRRHVMDWGDCDDPDACECSHAQALRSIQSGDT